MELLLACACGLDPASETMLVQGGLAAALAAPWWFRGQIAGVVRRLIGTGPTTAELCDGEDGRPEE
jgi:hypothetical protein